jgi:translation initiation factor IF-1
MGMRLEMAQTQSQRTVRCTEEQRVMLNRIRGKLAKERIARSEDPRIRDKDVIAALLEAYERVHGGL